MWSTSGILQNHDAVFEALDAGTIQEEVADIAVSGPLVRVPLMESYLLAAAAQPDIHSIVGDMGMGEVHVERLPDVVYRGSGSYTPVALTLEDALLSELPVTSSLGGPILDALVGVLYFSPSAVLTQVSFDLGLIPDPFAEE